MSNADLSPLFEPIKIGKLNLKNRIVMAPMCSRLPTADGEVTPEHPRGAGAPDEGLSDVDGRAVGVWVHAGADFRLYTAD